MNIEPIVQRLLTAFPEDRHFFRRATTVSQKLQYVAKILEDDGLFLEAKIPTLDPYFTAYIAMLVAEEIPLEPLATRCHNSKILKIFLATPEPIFLHENLLRLLIYRQKSSDKLNEWLLTMVAVLEFLVINFTIDREMLDDDEPPKLFTCKYSHELEKYQQFGLATLKMSLSRDSAVKISECLLNGLVAFFEQNLSESHVFRVWPLLDLQDRYLRSGYADPALASRMYKLLSVFLQSSTHSTAHLGFTDYFVTLIDPILKSDVPIALDSLELWLSLLEFLKSCAERLNPRFNMSFCLPIFQLLDRIMDFGVRTFLHNIEEDVFSELSIKNKVPDDSVPSKRILIQDTCYAAVLERLLKLFETMQRQFPMEYWKVPPSRAHQFQGFLLSFYLALQNHSTTFILNAPSILTYLKPLEGLVFNILANTCISLKSTASLQLIYPIAFAIDPIVYERLTNLIRPQKPDTILSKARARKEDDLGLRPSESSITLLNNFTQTFHTLKEQATISSVTTNESDFLKKVISPTVEDDDVMTFTSASLPTVAPLCGSEEAPPDVGKSETFPMIPDSDLNLDELI